MVRYFENKQTGRFYRVELIDEVISLRPGAIGTQDDEMRLAGSFS